MPEIKSPIRLNKYLALQLGISRREADNFIQQGKILINNMPVAMGARIHPGDDITISGKKITGTAEHQYIMLNKPTGYVCSRRPQGDNPTIYELIPKNLHHLKPVGRLDRDSSGLILLTNDGDFAFQMTHPKFRKTKVYHVQLDHPLQPLHQQMISDHGVQLEDGTSKFTVIRDDTLSPEAIPQTYIVTMHEGRNRQIRRTFGALGYTVTVLHRVQFGNYSLDTILPGDYTSATVL